MSRLWPGFALMALAACGSSPAPARVAGGAEAGSATAARPAESPTVIPRVLPSADQEGRSRAVPFERLATMLPSVEGWTRTDEKSEQLSTPGITTRAEAVYRQADSHVELEIADAAGDQLLLAPISVFLANGYYERIGDGVRRASHVGGYPAFEEWHPASRQGGITVLVGDRMIVRAIGHEVSSLEPVRRVVGAVSLSDLARLR